MAVAGEDWSLVGREVEIEEVQPAAIEDASNHHPRKEENTEEEAHLQTIEKTEETTETKTE